jgi:hypothetical protein
MDKMTKRFPRQSLVDAVELYEQAVRERETLVERMKQMSIERRRLLRDTWQERDASKAMRVR